MPVGKLRSALDSFASEIQEVRDLATAASTWPATHEQKHAVIELAFLKAFVGWEVFVEKTFYLYALGFRSPSRHQPKRFVRPVDEEHVTKLIRPQPIRYVDWTVPELIRARAQGFFEDGEPFESVLASSTHLLHGLKKIRNAVSHASSDATARFEDFASQALGRPCEGMNPGVFLLEKRPGRPPMTFLSHYLDALETAAIALVP